MGFFDKIKDSFKRMKEDNKYYARTTKRINSGDLYGYVNYKTGKMDPNDDFRAMSYVNVEQGKGIIYNTGDEDYTFAPGDIVSFELIGDGRAMSDGTSSLRYAVELKDGKKTTFDINCKKIEKFRAIFKLEK